MSTIAGSRRGQYSLLMALLAMPMVGVAAVSVDLGLMSVHASQAETVAYAAAHTAIVAYAEGKPIGEAELLARTVVDDHASVFDGQPYRLDEIQWGQVDRANGSFLSAATIEAARATVSRTGSTAVATFFAGAFGMPDSEIHGVAMSDQVPSTLHDDTCRTEIQFVRDSREAVVGLGDLSEVVTADIVDPPQSGWYRLYKAGVSESGRSQRNESAVFRLKNPTNPSGLPLRSEANCGEQYVMRDYDNGYNGHFRLQERVYLGTFYIDEDGPNELEMQHYCAFVDQCPQYHDLSQPCGAIGHSVHLKEGWALCGEAL